jgi:GNAT superfamily N-acetyltransferase
VNTQTVDKVSQVTLRELTPADYPRFCELRNLTMPEPITVELLLERDAQKLEGLSRQKFAACLGEDVVGAGQLTHWPSMADGLYFMNLDVFPEHRRKGYATTLLEHLEETAGPGTALIATTRDDRPEGTAFMEAKGFTFKQHLFDSVLDLSEFDATVYKAKQTDLERSCVLFVRYPDWGDTEENRRVLHEVHNICDADTPGIEEWGLSTYESFVADLFESRRKDMLGMHVAFDGDRMVGLSMVAPVSDEGYGTHFTGVLPESRGRGIGLVLKGLCVQRAKEAGAKWIRAQNDKNNPSMLAVNAKLGFEPQFGWIYMRKSLAARG